MWIRPEGLFALRIGAVDAVTNEAAMFLQLGREDRGELAVCRSHRQRSPTRFERWVFEVNVLAGVDDLVLQRCLSDVRRHCSGNLDSFAGARLLRPVANVDIACAGQDCDREPEGSDEKEDRLTMSAHIYLLEAWTGWSFKLST